MKKEPNAHHMGKKALYVFNSNSIDDQAVARRNRANHTSQPYINNSNPPPIETLDQLHSTISLH